MRRLEPAEGKVEGGDCRFLGIAFAPGAFSQSPADLVLAGQALAPRLIDPLQPAKSEQLTIALPLDQPERMAEVALISVNALNALLPIRAILDLTQMTHHRRGVHHRVESVAV